MKAAHGGVARADLYAAITLHGSEVRPTLQLEKLITAMFDETREPLRRYLRRCFNLRSSEAEETVQEAFLRLYKYLAGGGKVENLKAWVYRVAHNTALNELKRRSHVETVRGGHTELTASSVADSAPNPEEAFLCKERMARIGAAISALSEQQRECLYLRAEGFRYREIAKILGITVPTVAQSLRRAITKVAKESDV
jgi:RNA polymerase sigma-70 factor, ECF subfamily